MALEQALVLVLGLGLLFEEQALFAGLLKDPAYGCGASSCDASECPNPGIGGSVRCQDEACVIDTCPANFKKCGDKCVSIDDPNYGCGDITCDASSCPDPGSGTLTCKAGACVIGACGADTKSCSSKCVPMDANNGCADAARCTACATNEACGGSPSTCQCVPTSQSTACAGKCGSVSNGCGGNHACGSCSSPNTCGGGGTANVCGCTALSKAAACGAKTCGTVSDGCSGNHSCGTCSAGTMCLSGSCKECGTLADCGEDYFSCTNGTCSCAAQTSVNLLTNAGFDRTLTGWTVTAAKWNGADSDNCPRSGSLAFNGGRVSQCYRGAVGNKDYTLGLRVIGASDTPVGCFGSFHADTSCTSGVGPQFINLAGGGTGNGFWEPTSASALSPAATKSILVECFTNGGSGVANIDQIYLSVGKPGSAGAHF